VPGERIGGTQALLIEHLLDLAAVVHALSGYRHGSGRFTEQVEVGPGRCAGEGDAADRNGLILQHENVGALGPAAGLLEREINLQAERLVISGDVDDGFVVILSRSQATPCSIRVMRSPATTKTSKRGCCDAAGRSQPCVNSMCKSETSQTFIARLLLNSEGEGRDVDEAVGGPMVPATRDDPRPSVPEGAHDVDVFPAGSDVGGSACTCLAQAVSSQSPRSCSRPSSPQVSQEQPDRASASATASSTVAVVRWRSVFSCISALGADRCVRGLRRGTGLSVPTKSPASTEG
jgi:hypothetical protein